jgi:predicted dehydrogenase
VCNTLWYRDDTYYSVPWRGKWETELGGPTLGHGIHLMDSFLWLLGDWEEVTAKVATLARDIEVEDVSMAIIQFKSGAMATIVNSVLSPRQETYLRIDCELGTVETSGLYSVENSDWRWTPVHGETLSVPKDNGEHGGARDAGNPAAAWSAIPAELPSNHTTQIVSVYDDMDLNRRPLTSGIEARRTLELLSAIYKSAFTGRTVHAAEIRKGDQYYETLNGHRPEE